MNRWKEISAICEVALRDLRAAHRLPEGKRKVAALEKARDDGGYALQRRLATSRRARIEQGEIAPDPLRCLRNPDVRAIY